MDLTGKRYMRLDEVATLVGVHPRTLKRWWEDGQVQLDAWVPSHTLVGRVGLRFTTESVNRMISAGGITPGEYGEGKEAAEAQAPKAPATQPAAKGRGGRRRVGGAKV